MFTIGMMVNSEWNGFNLYLHEWLILMVNVYVNVLVKMDPMGCESPGPGFLENNPNPNNLLNWWLVNRVS